MDLFRRKQKVIIWIISLIIIPSFVLVWGVSDSFGNQSEENYLVGTIDGKAIRANDFMAFRKRIQAAVGGIPYQFAGSPGSGTEAEEWWKYLVTYAVLQDAEKAGCRASDLQIGTYLENGHPVLAGARKQDDPQSLERAVDSFCRQMQISRRDFLQGVRDWHTLGNYILADAELSALSDDTFYTYYAYTKAECVVRRIRIVETDSMRQEAQKAVMEKPAADLEQEIREFARANAENRRYREPSGWRFAWVLTPFVPEMSVHQPAEAELREAYEQGKGTVYRDKTFEEAQDAVKADLLKREVDSQTYRNATMDVDPQLRDQGAKLDLSELVKLTPLAKYSVTAGDTGEEILDIDAVVKKLPAGSEFEVRFILEDLESRSESFRNDFVNQWKNGFDMELRPFKSDVGYYRLRLLDYRPSKPAPIDLEDGSLRPEIRDLAIVDMVNRRLSEMIGEKTETMEAGVRAYMEAREKGEEAPDAEFAVQFEGLERETLPYLSLPQDQYDLGRMPIGELLGPLPYTDPETATQGQELIVLVDRRLPSRAEYEMESQEVKNILRQNVAAGFQGNYGFSYTTMGPTAVLQPGPAIMGDIIDRLNKSRIILNPELLRAVNNEG